MHESLHEKRRFRVPGVDLVRCCSAVKWVIAAILVGFRGTPKRGRGLPWVALPLRILAVVQGLMQEVHTANVGCLAPPEVGEQKK